MKLYKKFLPTYLFILALLIGIELCLGIFTAPAIFFPERVLKYQTLSHFESGLIMTQVFLKFNKILLIVSLVSFLMELLPLYWKAKGQILKLFLAFIVLFLAASFIFYFTRNIVELQKLGASVLGSKDFNFYHNLSEEFFKILIFFQVVLFFVKIRELQK